MENVVFLMICMEKWWCVGGLVRWGVVHLTPKGTQVAVSSYSHHHNAESQPFEYAPERWLDSDAEPLKHMISYFAPFST